MFLHAIEVVSRYNEIVAGSLKIGRKVLLHRLPE